MVSCETEWLARVHHRQLIERARVSCEQGLPYLDTPDVAVSINAVHYCVKARGVMDGTSSTHTTAMDGAFRQDPALRAEFLR